MPGLVTEEWQVTPFRFLHDYCPKGARTLAADEVLPFNSLFSFLTALYHMSEKLVLFPQRVCIVNLMQLISRRGYK